MSTNSALKKSKSGKKDSFVITAEHTTEFYSWGSDHEGQLGLGLLNTGLVDETIPGCEGKGNTI